MTRQRTADRVVPLTGVPSGLAAYPVEHVRADSTGAETVVRTRRGHIRLALVELRADGSAPGAPELEPETERFLLGAQRRSWTTIERSLGVDAWEQAVELARRDVVTIRCRVEGASRLGSPMGWQLTEAWARRRSEEDATRRRLLSELATRRDAAAAGVEARCPPLASAVRDARPGGGTLEVLVAVAEDFIEGVTHAGPRAFSQAHFGDTKARDDVVDVLRGAGVPDHVVASLGLRRSARIGVAGPIQVLSSDQPLQVDALDGPVLLRADQLGLRLSWRDPAPLVVVENLQAAEAVSDRHSGVGLLYTAGMLGPAALRLVADLAGGARGVVIACDADPGGVRIAEQLLGVVPEALLLDVGELPHRTRERWAPDGVAIATLQTGLDGPARSLAAACLRRGYPVEQEAVIVNAVAAALEDLREGQIRGQ